MNRLDVPNRSRLKKKLIVGTIADSDPFWQFTDIFVHNLSYTSEIEIAHLIS